MRRTIIYSLCCASLLLSSCDLDVPVTDRLPDEEVWKDDNLITGVFSRLYNQMQMEHNSTYFEGWDVWNVSLVTASDEGTGAYQAGDLGTGDVARAISMMSGLVCGRTVLRLFERRIWYYKS